LEALDGVLGAPRGPRPSFRPFAEALEARILLATYRWEGNASHDWTDFANWKVTEGDAGGKYPGEARPDDIVVFDNLAKTDCHLTRDLVLQHLHLKDGFEQVLEIRNGRWC
jgi:hypothetical protein